MPAAAAPMRRLDFPEKLIQSGKGQTAQALLKRMKTLHLKLKELEQDMTDVKSLDPVRAPLINKVIMHHPDRGVKAYAACCLADLLRLYAPNAPFTAEELRDIFQFMVAQIAANLKAPPVPTKPAQTKGRANTESQSGPAASQRITDVPYYAEYYHLLENLATIKSVVLCLDVPDWEGIMTSFFECFVDIVRNDMSKNLIRHMRDIMIELLEEASSVPSGVMDCIISQFESQSETPNNPSFLLIQDVCNKTHHRLTRAVYAHFSEIQHTHGRSGEATASDFETLADSHALMITMYRYCPNLLINVVPLLDENLKVADEVQLRQLSTKTLGTMFGMRPVVGGGVADLAKTATAAWRSWVGRKVDKALPVRLAWVEAAGAILANQPDLRTQMETELCDRIQDSEEKVRAAICRIIGGLDYETALHHLKLCTLQAVGARMSDKKATVRSEACNTLANLWRQAYSAIESDDSQAIAQFAWIPSALLSSLMHRDVSPDTRSQMTSVFKSLILPLPAADALDEQAWVDRLLLVCVHLDEGGMKALERLSGLKGFRSGNVPYRAFVNFCEENNGGIIDGDEKTVKAIKTRLDFVINAIAQKLFGDANKARKDLHSFADVNDPRLYKLFKACVDHQTDLKTLIKAKNELLRKIEQSHADILDTFTTLIDNASWNILNHSSIPPLIKRLQRAEGPNAEETSVAAFRLLGLISKECPPMFKSHVTELVIVMGDKKNERLSEAALRGLAAVCKYDDDAVPEDKRAMARSMQKAMEGTPKQAKYAARWIAASKQVEAPGELLDNIIKLFPDVEEERLLPCLRVMAELALAAPVQFEERSDDLMDFVLNQVMFKPSPSSEDDSQDEWVPEEELETLDRAKLLGLRICTHRALGLARLPEASKAAKPVFDLISSIFANDGQVNEQTGEGGKARHHLKLRAALCALKLAHARSYDKAMEWEFFESVAATLQEPVFHVRNHFLLKLADVLPSHRLQPRWGFLPVLVAKDPAGENIQVAASIMQSLVRTAPNLSTERIDRIEMPLARLLLVLSHHPDLDDSQTSIREMAKFIEFFVDCIATKENINLLLHIAAKLKTVKDSMNDDSSNLYRMSEIAQIILQNRAAAHNWPLSSYPGTIRLPRDGFHNFKSNPEASANYKRAYLSVEAQDWLKGVGKRSGGVAGPSRRAVPRDSRSTSPKKRPAKRAKKAGASKKRKSRKGQDSDEDEDTELDDEDEDEDGQAGTGSEAAGSAMEEEEGAGGTAVEGRGGKRGAKTKAKKAVSKKKAKHTPKKKKKKGSDDEDEDEMDLDEEANGKGTESDLTDIDA